LNGAKKNTVWEEQIEIKEGSCKMNNTLQEAGTGSMVGVKLEEINLSFGKTHVLKGIDLQIKPGEFFAFLGPSGCGGLIVKGLLLRQTYSHPFLDT